MTKIGKITLITETESTDSIGQIVRTESTTDVIAEVKSVTQSEFMQGKQGGLSPEFVFHVSCFMYSGQKILKYEGRRYSIYRTFMSDENYIELYAEQEVGASGKEEEEP